MKRDLDLVRAILITAENSDEPIGDDVLLSIEPDAKKMAYHLELMQAHGLINVTVKYDGLNKTPYMLKLHSVTWEGYDYLDAIRSARVWFWSSVVLTGNPTCRNDVDAEGPRVARPLVQVHDLYVQPRRLKTRNHVSDDRLARPAPGPREHRRAAHTRPQSAWKRPLAGPVEITFFVFNSRARTLLPKT